MAITFDGQAMFGDGPSRFVMGGMGRFVLPPFASVNDTERFLDVVSSGFTIQQTGWLVAASAEGVWALFDVIRVAASTGATGDLVDDTGRMWAGMRMIGFEATGPIEGVDDRWTQPYTVSYRAFPGG